METVENLQIGAIERAALQAAMHRLKDMREPERTVMKEALEQIARANDLEGRKRLSNQHTEPLRRRLVGAHVPLELADQVKECADLLGLSVYRFVTNCLEDACQRVPRPPPRGHASASSLSAPRGGGLVPRLPKSGQKTYRQVRRA